MRNKLNFLLLISLVIAIPCYALTVGSTPDLTPAIYLWLALSILMSRSFAIVKKIGLPLVTSEILAGVALGNLHFFGIQTFAGMENNEIIKFLAEIGAMILMFEIGLETQLEDISSKIGSGIKIALFGTLLTFIGGYYLTDLFYPTAPQGSRMLMGLVAAATATGISGKVFKDLKIINSIEVQTVLTASLIDEVISIMCFAVLSGILITGNFSSNELVVSAAKTTLFFLISISLGRRITPLLTRFSAKIHAGISMKIGILFMLCTFYTWLASMLNLAPVIGAFIAGLIINPDYFRDFSQAKFLRDFKYIAQHTTDENAKLQIIKTVNTYELKSLDELIKPLSNIFVPIFFTYIGLIFRVEDLANPKILCFTLAFVVISILGRIISGFSEQNRLNKWVIGLGMTPVGEAGLIFAITGNQLGLINNEIMSSVILTLVLVTILTPILLKIAIKHQNVKRIHI